MAYDANKDKLIEDLGEIDGDSGLFVEIRAYDGSSPKLSAYRVIGKNKDKRKQVCRLSITDAAVLGPYLAEFTADRGAEFVGNDKENE